MANCNILMLLSTNILKTSDGPGDNTTKEAITYAVAINATALITAAAADITQSSYKVSSFLVDFLDKMVLVVCLKITSIFFLGNFTHE